MSESNGKKIENLNLGEILISRDGDTITIYFKDPIIKGHSIGMVSNFKLCKKTDIYRIFEYEYLKNSIEENTLFFSNFSCQKDEKEILYSKIDNEIAKEYEDRLGIKIVDKFPDKSKCYGSYWSMKEEIPNKKYFEEYVVNGGLGINKQKNIPYNVENIGRCLISVKTSICNNKCESKFFPFFKNDYYYDTELSKKYKIYHSFVKYTDEKEETIKFLNHNKFRKVQIDLSTFGSFKDINEFKQENETRYYIYREDEKTSIKGIKVEIDPSIMIEEIYLDPRIKEKYPDYNNQIIGELKELGYENKIKKCS